MTLTPAVARAQSAAGQHKQPDAEAVGRQQAQLRLDMLLLIRELSERAEHYLDAGDCDRFNVLYSIIDGFERRDETLIKGDFLYRSPQLGSLESYQKYGDVQLTKDQLEEVRKYSRNCLEHLDKRLKTATCGKQANMTGWAITPGKPINRPCILDRNDKGTQLRSRFADEPSDPAAVRRARLQRQAMDAFALAEVPTSQVLIDCVIAEVSAGGQSLRFPHTSYLGSNSGGIDHLGLLNVGDWMRGWSAGATTKVYFNDNAIAGNNPFAGGFLQFGITGGSATQNSFISSFDPGPGANLLIAGPNGGASGFLLGGWPLNIATNLVYSAKLDEFDLNLGYGKPFQVSASTSLTPKVFVIYSHTNFSESTLRLNPRLRARFPLLDRCRRQPLRHWSWACGRD